MKEKTLTNESVGSLCRALSHLIHAGIGVGDALMLLWEDEQDPTCKKVLADMAQLGDRGASLATAFRSVGCFPAYVCALLTVGEQVGKTEETLTALADYYGQREQLNRQLRAALLYPVMLLGVLLAVMVILLVWVLPIFDDVYARLGSRLTGVAGGLLAVGELLGKLLPFLCGILILAVVLGLIPPVRSKLVRWWRIHRSDKGLSGAINTARFVQALSMALDSGMTGQEAVALAASLFQGESTAFRARCDSCMAALDAGATLPQALRDAGFLSPAHRRLLEAGVRSGRSEAVIAGIARDLADGCQERMYRAVGKAEPALVAVACVLIGTVLLSVMLPLMHIMNAIG